MKHANLKTNSHVSLQYTAIRGSLHLTSAMATS